jgi:hypothetical protein
LGVIESISTWCMTCPVLHPSPGPSCSPPRPTTSASSNRPTAPTSAFTCGTRCAKGAGCKALYQGQKRDTNGCGGQLWLAIVTSSTTGYGDMVPKTHLGRLATVPLISVVWAKSRYNLPPTSRDAPIGRPPLRSPPSFPSASFPLPFLFRSPGQYGRVNRSLAQCQHPMIRCRFPAAA